MTRTQAVATEWYPSDGQATTERRAEVIGFPTTVQKRITLAEPTIEWADKVKRRLTYLCGLRAGWDGYNGRPIRFDTSYFTLQLLQRVCSPKTPPPEIVPLSSGGLQVEWHHPHAEIELTIRAPYDVKAWVSQGEEDEEGTELLPLTTDFTSIVPYIQKLG